MKGHLQHRVTVSAGVSAFSKQVLWPQRYVAVATSLSKVFAALFVCFELICHDAMSPEGVGNAAGRTSTSGEQVSRWVLVESLREARREPARSSLD